MAIINYANELQIASGWNNTAGYALITALTDADSIPYRLPKPLRRNQGHLLPTLSRRNYRQASPVYFWIFPFITLKGIYKLDNDYQQTNSGMVTVRTIAADNAATDFNAYIVFDPDNYEMAGDDMTGIGTLSPGNHRANYAQNFTISFSVVGTPS